MYKNLLFNVRELEHQYRYQEETQLLIKVLHNKMLNDYPYEEVIEELLYVLKNMKGYKEGWNEAVEELNVYGDVEYI